MAYLERLRDFELLVPELRLLERLLEFEWRPNTIKLNFN